MNTTLAKAERDLSFTSIRAPFDGTVANRAVEPGQFVQGGTRLMALVPADGAYIEANFKETQLADLHAGQKAEISIDAFDGEVFEGHVLSLAPASGSEFSLLPPENATGNFTKITQRVPVKVSVPAELAAKLRPGLSVTVTVDTRDAPRNNIMAATATISGALQPPAKTGFNKRHLAAFLFMVFGMFMAILDIQIVSSSLAEIQAGISASADEISWVQTSYLIAEVVMIPLSGMLSRILSTRILFTVSAIGFTAMSFMCAMSGSINEMIVWRALQGFVGGAMIPTVFAVTFTVFPADKRVIITPVIGLIATLAPTIGPTVGGYLTELFSWHWLFLINVIPGIAVAIGAWLLIDFDKPDFKLAKTFDWRGAGAARRISRHAGIYAGRRARLKTGSRAA